TRPLRPSTAPPDRQACGHVPSERSERGSALKRLRQPPHRRRPSFSGTHAASEAWLWQGDETRPPERLAADREILTADELELTVGANPEQRHVRGDGVGCRLVTDGEHAPLGIERERARRESVRVHVL